MALLGIFVVTIFALAGGCDRSADRASQAVVGAERLSYYLPMLSDKRVGLVANQTSMAGDSHLVDILVSHGINLQVIFAPEHGFREMADAGQHISGGYDEATGIRLVSLYGASFKPAKDDMEDIDVVIFDIQDVGARFYTYISTMHYVMESAAENDVSVIVFDRPNPHGHYFDGPVLDTAYRSFVGMHPVPVVHGMTVGEYAMMINGEGWLARGVRCNLHVVECLNYTHGHSYELPVRPSPNLPNQTAVYLYPSLCFFEGTNISVGRGTLFPFQVYGSPKLPDSGFSFMPESMPGAVNPPFKGERCYGSDLRDAMTEGVVPPDRLQLDWLMGAYRAYPDKDNFFNTYFDRLAGTSQLRKQIEEGLDADEIRDSWSKKLTVFADIREKYLLYDH